MPCFLLLCGLAHPPLASAADSPAPVFGADIRLRAEGFDNVRDLRDGKADSASFYNDSYHFYRMRYRLWADAKPREGLRLYIRLGNEYRWGVFGGALDKNGNVIEAASIRDSESRVSLDNGWAEIQGPKRSGLSFRFGRMDLMYGEGFLIFDGTPADGSASAYFDAMTLTWRRGPLTADLLTAKLQDEGFGTKARDEDLYGLYLRSSRVFGRESPGKEVHLYLLNRNKHGVNATSSGVIHPKQYTTALGARIAVLPETGWQAVVEGAYEWGKYCDRNQAVAGRPDNASRRATGGYARGGWTSPAGWRPGIELGGMYLSGDRPGPGRYEGWDGFYSEWPKWSELYVYTLYDNTTRIGLSGSRAASPDDAGTWTNLTGAWLEGRLRPGEAIKGSIRGTVFGAAERTGLGPGRGRGLLGMAEIDWAAAPGVQCQVWGEYFAPGDFYAPGADPAWYGRAQITARY